MLSKPVTGKLWVRAGGCPGDVVCFTTGLQLPSQSPTYYLHSVLEKLLDALPAKPKVVSLRFRQSWLCVTCKEMNTRPPVASAQLSKLVPKLQKLRSSSKVLKRVPACARHVQVEVLVRPRSAPDGSVQGVLVAGGPV